MDTAMERAVECIREHYGEPLALARIAESALLSRFYFTRLFKEETGLTPGRFLAAVRMHETDPPVLLALPELVPPVTFVPAPGCPSITPPQGADDQPRAAGHLRLVSTAPVP